MTFDLVTIGHTARDEFEGDPEWRIGGTATYAAAAAACLGDRVALLTRVGPHERERLAARCAELGIELHALEQRLLAASLAYGRVDLFAPWIERLLGWLGSSPRVNDWMFETSPLLASEISM